MWSIVTSTFRNSSYSHGSDLETSEVMISAYPMGTLGSVASLLEVALYQGNPASFSYRDRRIVDYYDSDI